MSRIITICLSVLLVVLASPRVQSQQAGYTLSDAALAAAKRFSSAPMERKYEDLTVVLKELCKADNTEFAAKADCRPITRQQFIDLLGLHEAVEFVMWGVRYELRYGHNYGSTYFSFEDDRLKGFLFFGEPIYWTGVAPQPAIKRVWHKVTRWPRKLIGALF